MAPVTEICRFTPKEGKEADYQALLADIGSTLLQQPGVKDVLTSGIIEKDNPTELLFVEWDSIDSHEAFQSTDIYGPFVQKLVAVVSGPPIVYHVAFSPEHPSVLHNLEGKGSAKTPVVELLHMYFPAGEAFTADQIAATAKQLQQFLAALEGNAGGHTGETAAGWAVEELEHKGEKARAYVIAIGWESVEAHLKYRETEHFKEIIPLLRGLDGVKGVEVFHVSTKSWRFKESL